MLVIIFLLPEAPPSLRWSSSQTLPERILCNLRLCGNSVFGKNDFEELTLFPFNNILCKVRDNVFGTNSKLKKVTLLNNEKSSWKFVYSKMFSYCSALSEISLPPTIEVLSDKCFENTAIKTFSPFHNVYRIEYGVFFNCHCLEEIDYSLLDPTAKIPLDYTTNKKLKKVKFPIFFESENFLNVSLDCEVFGPFLKVNRIKY